MAKKLIDFDVTDKRELQKHGYNPSIYYCGNYSFQKQWTTFRDYLKNELGVEFPYNPACFKHDKLYATHPTLLQKLKIDWVFYNDMIKLLNVNTDKRLNHHYKMLKARARLFYFLVTVMTPIYIKQNKIKKND